MEQLGLAGEEPFSHAAAVLREVEALALWQVLRANGAGLVPKA